MGLALLLVASAAHADARNTRGRHRNPPVEVVVPPADFRDAIHEYERAHPCPELTPIEMPGPHSAVVSRIATTSREKAAASLVEAAPVKHGEWDDPVDGVPIPRGVNAAIACELMRRSDCLRSGASCGGIQPESSRFEYAVKSETLEEVAINGRTHRWVVRVTLRVEWSQYCGNVCALDFKRRRVAYVDDQGRIISLEDDDSGGVIMS